MSIEESLINAGKKWAKSKNNEREAMRALYAEIWQAHAHGLAETRIADLAGVDRMTVRRALGKR